MRTSVVRSSTNDENFSVSMSLWRLSFSMLGRLRFSAMRNAMRISRTTAIVMTLPSEKNMSPSPMAPRV